MPKVIPDRIKLARRLCRYSMADMVRQMGECAISKMAVSKMERGLMNPSAATLQAIAAACHQPVSFFCEPDFNLGRIDYRFKKEVNERQREEIIAMADDFLQRYFKAQSVEGDAMQFIFPLRGIVLRNYSDAEEAAFKLRRKWDIGLQPIHSVYEMLASYGFHVLELDFGYDNVDGISAFINERIPVILINKHTNTTTERKRFTALHELCHLLFKFCPNDDLKHRNYIKALPELPYEVIIKKPNEERLCDLFASAMLMPEKCVQRRFGSMRTNISVEEFIATRNLYGISVAAQIHRLHDLRIIDEGLYNDLYKTIIHPNQKEEGLGGYPIMETGNRFEMLELRLHSEMMVSKGDE